MITRLDHWIGKHFFVPLIIRFCQKTGWTQYAVHRYGWTVGLMLVVWTLSPIDIGGWFVYGLIAIATLANIVAAAILPDYPTRPQKLVRNIVLMITTFDMVLMFGCIAFAAPFSFAARVSDVLVLFAEYALTITTIPPKEVKERQRKTAESVS